MVGAGPEGRLCFLVPEKEAPMSFDLLAPTRSSASGTAVVLAGDCGFTIPSPETVRCTIAGGVSRYELIGGGSIVSLP